jgi:hypothetical protein
MGRLIENTIKILSALKDGIITKKDCEMLSDEKLLELIENNIPKEKLTIKIMDSNEAGEMITLETIEVDINANNVKS